MAYSITRRDLEYAHSAATRAMHGFGRLRGRGEAAAGQFMQTACVSAAAFGFGVLNGNMGPVDVLNVPVDLGAGILFQIGAYAKVGGKWNKTLADLGDGALAAYLTKLGASIGDGMRRKSGRKIARGAFPASAGERVVIGGDRRPLSENELAAFAASAR
jgi:hypothetical protein